MVQYKSCARGLMDRALVFGTRIVWVRFPPGAQMSKLKSTQFIVLLFLALISLADYQIAKYSQTVILHLLPMISYAVAISAPWLFISALLCIVFNRSGLAPHLRSLKQNWKLLTLLFFLVTGGLLLFVFFHITRYFHGVKHPVIFFLITPLAEEMLFRGVVYAQLKKMDMYPIFGSALLFSLHHLQYFNYHFTRFAIFQMTYTFLLGILFGFMRKKSDSVYPSLLSHMFINWTTVYF